MDPSPLLPFIPGAHPNDLGDFILNTAVRTAVLMGVVWYLLLWDRNKNPKVIFVWVLGAVLAGVLSLFVIAAAFNPAPPRLAASLIQSGTEMAVILVMLVWERMGLKAGLTIAPAYAIAGWLLGFM